MSWQESMHSIEERVMSRHVAERQILGQALTACDRGLLRSGQHCLDLGAEEETFRRDCIEERLDAEVIADQHRATAPSIVNRQSEDAVEPGGEARTILLVRVNEDLGIRVRAKPVASMHELA